MDDLISRAATIDAVENLVASMSVCVNVDEYNGTRDMKYRALKAINKLPSAQPDIKQAAKLLSDFIESCPGGDSYLITPDGENLRTDWGYAAEGIQLIHDWAERRTDG